MREFDAEGLAVCRFQGKVFEDSRRYANCSSAVFIRRFMNSDVAARLDAGSYLTGADVPGEVFAEIDGQYGASAYGKERYGQEQLYWMGYLYRYWSYVHEEQSPSIYKTIGARELRDLYAAYHTLDPAQAIERIGEAKGIGRRAQTIDEQVAALRRIRTARTAWYGSVHAACG